MRMLELAKRDIAEPDRLFPDHEDRELSRRCALSGGGDLDDIPTWWPATDRRFRITLIDDAEDVIQKIEAAYAA